MKVAVVGATGLVGRNMLRVLQERNFPVTELIPVASERSQGSKVEFNGKEYVLKENIESFLVMGLISQNGSTIGRFVSRFRWGYLR